MSGVVAAIRRSGPFLPLLGSLALHAGLIGGVLGKVRQGSSQAPRTNAGETRLIGITVTANPKAELSTTRDNRPTLGLREPEGDEGDEISAADTTTPAPSSATSDLLAPGALDAYASAVRARIGQNLRYPLSLRRRGVHGQVGLRLGLDGSGRIVSQEVAHGSGSRELDELALEALRAAQPFDAPPGGPLTLNLPIEFRLGQ